jgi:hypothetical protein
MNNVELHLRFLYLKFFPLVHNQMVFISRSWEGDDVFFDILNCDLTLWEAILLSCWTLFIFYHKFCELFTSIIASLLLQSLKFILQFRFPNSSTLNFRTFSNFSSHLVIHVMFFKNNNAFLLILNFFIDPWKNRNDILLIMNITFKRFRFLWVKPNVMHSQEKCFTPIRQMSYTFKTMTSY